MHGAQKIESTLLNGYKKYTAVILLIIWSLYILNVNNHYQLFLDEDARLRSSIESYMGDNRIVNGFINNIFSHAQLIGRTIPFFNKHVSGSNFKIVAIKRAHSDATNNNNLVRIINIVKNEKTSAKILVYSDDSTVNTLSNQINSDELSFVDQPSIYLLGDQNQIVSAFSLDGTESPGELRLISTLLLNIVSGQQ